MKHGANGALMGILCGSLPGGKTDGGHHHFLRGADQLGVECQDYDKDYEETDWGMTSRVTLICVCTCNMAIHYSLNKLNESMT